MLALPPFRPNAQVQQSLHCRADVLEIMLCGATLFYSMFKIKITCLFLQLDLDFYLQSSLLAFISLQLLQYLPRARVMSRAFELCVRSSSRRSSAANAQRLSCTASSSPIARHCFTMRVPDARLHLVQSWLASSCSANKVYNVFHYVRNCVAICLF